ncbi:hypothetical protein [Kerstersia gyiorum]|jgi:hypothetical protein|uniref:Uncharacterized protein n=1 Tax=Kerstersia gyiorum TaxID=206506 RepID=A0A171KPY1_9BURK|nr:hypothetical protein [Kerstersia gyiorum]AZV95127.1 hypothetical protein CBF45_16505 [Bordetella sp. J329]MCO7642728.1 hypothetical protein [Pseudomonas sp. S 311-6]KKO70948.1 hypothetical protein AAV32_13180 [Kerstersia gyiorum]MCH4271630.1 hypothetical protein [Kerstersia gyiorum]MCI1228934.1 hypothetical protein [Kerstersia gyiorum]
MSDRTSLPDAAVAPRRSRTALLRKWLLIALVFALVLVPLLVWVSHSGAAGQPEAAPGSQEQGQ